MKEQVLNACHKDLATHLEEQKLQTLKDVTEAAERYLIAHGKTLGPPSATKHFQKTANHGNQIQGSQT
ncbi:hypothetical protein, partial [Acinetobacter baumannii]|uniref:hypothetical protein n=1 Tax=Acinetobacter baumannii TaxID=470 RepID=UPI0033932385